MIEIHPLRDRDRLKEIYCQNNVEFCDNSIAVLASDQDEILGFCLFDMGDKELTVKKLHPENDLMFLDGILRSALHVGVENGKRKAFFTDGVSVDALNKLGFIKNVETNELDVEKLFSSCHSCGK